MRGEKKIYTDVDGVLLNMNKAFWGAVQKVVGPAWGTVEHWDYRQTAGISEQKEKEVWKEIWNTPLELFPCGRDIVEYIRKNEIPAMAVSVRPEGEAFKAAKRDFHKLRMDWQTFGSHKTKEAFVLRRAEFDPGEILYIEDNWGMADRVSRAGVKTILVNQPYNSSKDLDVKYIRLLHHEVAPYIHAWVNEEVYGYQDSNSRRTYPVS